MKRLFSITLVMLLSSTMFFTVVYAGEHELVKPTKGTWSGVTYFLGPTASCPTTMIQAIGKGVMTLTGESQWIAEPACLDASGFASGPAVITAANGDQINLMTGIQFIPDPSGTAGMWVQDSIGIGGTGRFEGTGGSSHSEGVYKLLPSGTEGVWVGTNEGELTF
jgi:hypothetical protein